jgi:hypothetical protein
VDNFFISLVTPLIPPVFACTAFSAMGSALSTISHPPVEEPPAPYTRLLGDLWATPALSVCPLTYGTDTPLLLPVRTVALLTTSKCLGWCIFARKRWCYFWAEHVGQISSFIKLKHTTLCFHIFRPSFCTSRIEKQ